MKKIIFISIMFFFSLSLSAEGFVEIGFMNNDSLENGGVPFVTGVAGGSNNPKKIVIDEVEGYLYYAYPFELIQVNINTFSPVCSIDITRIINRIFSSSKVIPLSDGYYTDRYDIFKDLEEVIMSNFPGGQYGGAINIGDYLFYYSGSYQLKGPIRAVSIDGEELNTDQAIEQLRSYIETWSDDEKEVLLPVHEEMLDSGHYLLVGNRYYTTKIGDLFDYFKEVYEVDYSDYFQYLDNVELLNYDNSGNSYWLYRGHSIDGDSIFCFSPTGEMLLKTDFSISLQTTEFVYNGTSMVWDLYVVPSGNIYLSVSNAFGTILYRYNRIWGAPNMVTLAINGLDGTDYDDYVYEVLDGFSTEDLRLQRNMVFALKDYRFSSTDLLEYYGQFNWYDPEKTIEEASAELTDNQLRFVNYIREVEAARN